MKKRSILHILLILAFVLGISSSKSMAQSTFKDFGYKGGFQINLLSPTTEFESDNGISLKSFSLRGFFRYELSKDFQTEFGLGFGKLNGSDFNYALNKKGTGEYITSIIPIDARLLYTPFELPNLNPYFYAGLGLMNYSVGTKPSVVSKIKVDESGWTGIIPFGVGTEIKLSDEVALDLNLGYTYSFTDNLNYFKIDELNDGAIHLGVGISFSNESLNTDKDNDGLLKGKELEIGTDPNNADSDGDGLNDGVEVNQYKTNPLKADTDNDGLNDGEELSKFKTNPLNADTDNDGLNDGEELSKFKTDPLNADSDKDGLNDGEEVLKFKTDPLKADTDGDGLNDGAEVTKHKTDPLKVDTDGGTIGDGIEVNRGTNPLDPKDDIPVKWVEKESSYENVLFGFNKRKLAKKETVKLDAAFDAITAIKDAKVILGGHADAIGSEKYNLKLSEKRANIAKEYLVKKGMNAEIITVEFFGESNPLADNKTAKGRAQNRRTEVKAKYMVEETK